jgi:predicted 2-oxoglutarate/Fe(II)-dependent dioxygenase YbiX
MSTTKSDPFSLYNNEGLSGLEKIAHREAVNHPSHYNAGSIEVIDAIEDWGLDFNAGNVVKYVARHQHKANPVEDLKKARWYLDRIIERIEKCQ